MDRRRSLLLALTIWAACSLLLLGGCSTSPVEDMPGEAGQVEAGEAAAEPTEAPTAVAAPTDATLDENISAFLDGMEGFNSTNPADVHDAIDRGDAPFLIDLRDPDQIEAEGHIPGAVNLPFKELAQNVDKLPSPDTPIVVYCGAGMRAAFGTMALGELGYTHVKAMMGGSFGGWTAAGFPVTPGLPEEAPVLDAFQPDSAVVAAVDRMLQNLPDDYAQLMPQDLQAELDQGSDVVLIDVRTPEEIEVNSQIEGAINIPLDQMIARKDEWPSPDADVVVYCGVGYRGNLAMAVLRGYGYEKVRNLSGGFNGWVGAGLPFAGSDEVTEDASPQAVNPEALATFEQNMQPFFESLDENNTVTPAEVNAAIATGNPPLIMDIRTQEALEKSGYYILGALVLPKELLVSNINRLPSKSLPIIVYGDNDAESALATVALASLGYTDVTSLQGGSFTSWKEADYPMQRYTGG